jgi:hypothetical protein
MLGLFFFTYSEFTRFPLFSPVKILVPLLALIMIKARQGILLDSSSLEISQRAPTKSKKIMVRKSKITVRKKKNPNTQKEYLDLCRTCD